MDINYPGSTLVWTRVGRRAVIEKWKISRSSLRHYGKRMPTNNPRVLSPQKSNTAPTGLRGLTYWQWWRIRLWCFYRCLHRCFRWRFSGPLGRCSGRDFCRWRCSRPGLRRRRGGVITLIHRVLIDRRSKEPQYWFHGRHPVVVSDVHFVSDIEFASDIHWNGRVLRNSRDQTCTDRQRV